LLWQGHTSQLTFPLLVPCGAFVLASVLATMTGVAPFKSLVELRNVFEVLIFYLVVNEVTTEQRATALITVLIAASTGMALYGLTQSLAQGVDFRVHGTMSSYMTFAGLLMLVSLMTVAQCLFWSSRRQLSWGVPAAGLLTAALLMTHTRSAWCGLLAGGAVLCGLYQKWVLLALPLAAVLILLVVPQPVKARALSILDRSEITAQERISMWVSGLHILRDYPWTGIGMGTMARLYDQYREPDSPVKTDRRIGHLHNNVVQIAAERGLLGLACWLWIWLAYGYHAWRIYRRLDPAQRRARALVVGSLASVVAFQIDGLFEYAFGDSEVITLTYFLMALPFVVQRAHEGQHHATA